MKKQLIFVLALSMAFAFAMAPMGRVMASPPPQGPDCTSAIDAESDANAKAIPACAASVPGGRLRDAESPAPPAAVLYDNGPYINAPGGGPGGSDGSVVQTSLGLVAHGWGHSVSTDTRVADDFTITGDAGWQVDSILFFAFQLDSTTTSTFNHVNYRIWDGPPGVGSSSVIFGDTTTNRLTNSVWHNSYRYRDTTPGTTRPVMINTASAGFVLPPGTYWLDWQAEGTLTSGAWQPPITINGQTTTGNARQYVGYWYWTGDSGFPQGFPFIITGSLLPPTSIELSSFQGGGAPHAGWLLGLAGLTLLAVGLIARRR